MFFNLIIMADTGSIMVIAESSHARLYWFAKQYSAHAWWIAAHKSLKITTRFKLRYSLYQVSEYDDVKLYLLEFYYNLSRFLFKFILGRLSQPETRPISESYY